MKKPAIYVSFNDDGFAVITDRRGHKLFPATTRREALAVAHREAYLRDLRVVDRTTRTVAAADLRKGDVVVITNADHYRVTRVEHTVEAGVVLDLVGINPRTGEPNGLHAEDVTEAATAQVVIVPKEYA